MREKLPLKNADTGNRYETTVEVPEHAPTHVRVTFGNSFSMELPWEQAEDLVAVMRMAIHQAMEND